jgi:hypothetical protein
MKFQLRRFITGAFSLPPDWAHIDEPDYESILEDLRKVRGKVSLGDVARSLEHIDGRPGLDSKRLAEVFEQALIDPLIDWHPQAVRAARALTWEWAPMSALREGVKVV